MEIEGYRVVGGEDEYFGIWYVSAWCLKGVNEEIEILVDIETTPTAAGEDDEQ